MDVVKFTLLILAGIFANQVNAQQHATPQQVDRQSDAQSIHFSTNNNSAISSNQSQSQSQHTNTNGTGVSNNTTTTVVFGTQDSSTSPSNGPNPRAQFGVQNSGNNTQMFNPVLVNPSNNSQGTLRGQLYIDANQNCSYDSGTDAPTSSVLVKATNSSGIVYSAIANSSGWYTLNLPYGNYQLSLELSNPYLDTTCTNNYTASIGSTSASTLRNFAFREVNRCPFMQVNLDVPIIQSCYPSACTVNYCNQGTDTAKSAYVEVELDSNIIVDSSSLSYVSLGGNAYLFNLGDVAENTCGSFYIDVHVPCDTTLLGQEHCITAEIFPDTTCESTWTGPILDIQAICTNGMISFAVRNTGRAMPQVISYIVIQDDLMLQAGGIIVQQGTIQLGSGQNKNISLAYQQGGSYRLQLVQANGLNAVLNVLLEMPINNCAAGVTNQQVFYANQSNFFTENESPFVAETCRTNGVYSSFVGQVATTGQTTTNNQKDNTEALSAIETTEIVAQLYPNPMDQVATIRITGELSKDSQFRLFDLTGKQVLAQTIESKQFNIYRNNLAAGYYFYKIESAGKIATIGKVILR